MAKTKEAPPVEPPVQAPAPIDPQAAAEAAEAERLAAEQAATEAAEAERLAAEKAAAEAAEAARLAAEMAAAELGPDPTLGEIRAFQARAKNVAA